MWVVISIIVGVVIVIAFVVVISASKVSQEVGQFTCPECHGSLSWKFDDHDLRKTEWFCKKCGYMRTEDRGEASHNEVR